MEHDLRHFGQEKEAMPYIAGGEVRDGALSVDALPLTPTPSALALYLAFRELKAPYLTCSRCNNVTFINVQRIRPKIHDHDESRLSEYELLPICSGCGSTKYLRAGVVSFQDKIEEEQIAIKEFERKRVPATALIQRIARGHLDRVAFKRRLLEREQYLRRINYCATLIQARVRGMQARRCAIIERCLRIIKAMHSSILTFALRARPDRPSVFWYDNPAERNIFFWNYREFVRRSGGRPALIKVEKNVLEITRRMLQREYALVSRIQSRWRGLTTRFVYFEFKRQQAWWKGIQQSPAIKIQRLVRAHHSRKRCRALKLETQYPTQREAYRQEMLAREKKQAAKAFRARLLAKYRVEFQVDNTTRMLALPTTSVASASLATDERTEPATIDPETYQHLQYSLKTSGPARSVNKNANSQRFAEMKQRLAFKHLQRQSSLLPHQPKQRLRGPMLHILQARQLQSDK